MRFFSYKEKMNLIILLASLSAVAILARAEKLDFGREAGDTDALESGQNGDLVELGFAFRCDQSGTSTFSRVIVSRSGYVLAPLADGKLLNYTDYTLSESRVVAGSGSVWYRRVSRPEELAFVAQLIEEAYASITGINLFDEVFLVTWE